MTSELKAFHISDILSASHGILVSSRGMEGVYDILSHMAGESLFTHQLPEVSRQAEPVLRAAHTFLNDIEIPVLTTEEECSTFIAEVVEKHGEFFAVEPLEVVHVPTMIEAISLARQSRDD